MLPLWDSLCVLILINRKMYTKWHYQCNGINRQDFKHFYVHGPVRSKALLLYVGDILRADYLTFEGGGEGSVGRLGHHNNVFQKERHETRPTALCPCVLTA